MSVDGKHHSAAEGEDGNDPDVVVGGVALGVQVPEDRARKNVVASHTEEQTRCPQASRERAAHRREDGHRRHGEEQPAPSHAHANVHKGARDVLKVKARPHALAQVDLDAAKDAGKQADQNRGQEHIALGVFDILGQRRHAVKPDVGERRQRHGAADDPEVKRFGIVKRQRGKYSIPAIQVEKVADGQEYKGHDDHRHQRPEATCWPRRWRECRAGS